LPRGEQLPPFELDADEKDGTEHRGGDDVSRHYWPTSKVPEQQKKPAAEGRPG
jgi:hypothetical protein